MNKKAMSKAKMNYQFFKAAIELIIGENSDIDYLEEFYEGSHGDAWEIAYSDLINFYNEEIDYLWDEKFGDISDETKSKIYGFAEYKANLLY